MFNLKSKKSSRYLTDQESFHSKKSTWYFLLYLILSMCAFVIFQISINISNIFHNQILTLSVGILAFAILFLANEKVYIPYRIHEKKSDDYFKGIIGEGRIQKELENLPKSDFEIFQHIEIPQNGDIDFMIVGQGTIFTIEVKYYSEKVTTDGKLLIIGNYKRGKSIIGKAKERTAFMHSVLKDSVTTTLFIQPLIVFAGRESVLAFPPCMIDGAFVCDEKSLIKTLAQYVSNNNRLPDEDSKKVSKIIESMAQIN